MPSPFFFLGYLWATGHGRRYHSRMRGDGSDDLVLWLMRELVDRVPGLPSNTIIEVEQMTRQHWGGVRAYVAKTPRQQHMHGANRTSDGQSSLRPAIVALSAF